MNGKNSFNAPTLSLEYLKYLTKRMISIPSPSGEEKDIAVFVSSELEKIGVESRFQRVEGNRSNVIASIRGKGDKSILFQGHYDTVPGYEWKEAFSGEERGGMIYGRGSVDMKSSLACVIAAMKSIVTSGVTPEKRIILVCTVDEEVEKRGIFKLVEEGIDASMAVCCEPTNLKIGIGHKGVLPFRLSTKGRATHGSSPQAGINAIYKMKYVLDVLEKNWRINETEIEGVGKASGVYSVGIIHGGDHFLIVPDWCNIWVDRRTIPGETKEEVQREVEGLLDPIRKRDRDFEFQIFLNERPDWSWPKIIDRGCKPVVISPEEEIVKLSSSAYKKEVGSDPELIFLPFWTEADFLVNELGIPTVIFGPGKAEKAHSITECVSVDQLLTTSRIYLHMMLS